MKSARLNLKQRDMVISLLGLLAGGLIILGIRFFTYAPIHIHYHANFVVFINGQREEFKDPSYYEATGPSCTDHEVMTPLERAHMHESVNDVVHVHDQAVTWGQFFTNLGWVVDAKVIETPSQLLVADDAHPITFWLNDQKMDNVSNRVIGDQDKLLVDYGSEVDSAKQEYGVITNKAAKYDASKDPASCGSQASPTFHDRVTHLF